MSFCKTWTLNFTSGMLELYVAISQLRYICVYIFHAVIGAPCLLIICTRLDGSMGQRALA